MSCLALLLDALAWRRLLCLLAAMALLSLVHTPVRGAEEQSTAPNDNGDAVEVVSTPVAQVNAVDNSARKKPKEPAPEGQQGEQQGDPKGESKKGASQAPGEQEGEVPPEPPPAEAPAEVATPQPLPEQQPVGPQPPPGAAPPEKPGAGTEAGNVAEGGTATPGNVAEQGGPTPPPGSEPPAKEKVPPGPVLVAPPTGAAPGEVTVGPMPIPPEAAAAPVEGGAAAGGEGLTPEELESLGLPGFAEEQPGFIPDTEPGDLFAEELPAAEGFESLIGPSELPFGSVDQEIASADSAPGMGLDDNFARIVVPSGSIEGSTETKQFHIEGGLKLYYQDVLISADIADIDEKQEVALLYGNVSIEDPKYTLKADELRINFGVKQFEASGMIQFNKFQDDKKSKPNMALDKKDRLREYFAGQKFELYCNHLFYSWDSKQLNAIGSVRIVHPSFNGSMERVDYNDKSKAYEMSGTVVLTVTEYDWVFENQLVDETDAKKVRALTDGDTKITCDRMVYSEETAIAEFYALPEMTVVFSQPKRSVTANYIEINDKTKDFYAEGTSTKQAVYAQQNGQWLFEGGLISRENVADDLATALSDPLKASADTLTYNYDRKRLELLGNVLVASINRTMTAAEIVQDETAKFFLLRGNVHIKPDDKSEVYAAQVYVDTENDVFTFVGLVQGQGKSDDLPSTTPAGSATGAQTGPGAGQPQVAEGLFQQNPEQLPGTPGSPPRGTSGVEDDEGANVAEGR